MILSRICHVGSGWSPRCCLPGLLLVLLTVGPLHGEDFLTGAGATLPGPLYRSWASAYQESEGVRIDYAAVGSSEGMRRLFAGETDFGATDIVIAARNGRTPVHIPTCVGAVAVVFHLPGITQIDLTPGIIADIFGGRIERWNHPALALLNPALPLPGLPITPIFRSDGSGTTYLFTDFLSLTDREWSATVGTGSRVRWVCGIGVEGNGNIAAFVEKIHLPQSRH